MLRWGWNWGKYLSSHSDAKDFVESSTNHRRLCNVASTLKMRRHFRKIVYVPLMLKVCRNVTSMLHRNVTAFKSFDQSSTSLRRCCSKLFNGIRPHCDIAKMSKLDPKCWPNLVKNLNEISMTEQRCSNYKIILWPLTIFWRCSDVTAIVILSAKLGPSEFTTTYSTFWPPNFRQF